MLEIFLCLAIALSIVYPRRGRKRDVPEQDAALNEEPDFLLLQRERIADLERKAEKAVIELSLNRRLIETLQKDRQLFSSATGVAGKLSDAVISLTQDSVNDLVTSIYEIYDASGNIGSVLKDLLREMTEGGQSFADLENELKTGLLHFSDLLGYFTLTKKSTREDMTRLKATVTGILDSSQKHVDLAEKTKVLAINASIEAARLGSKGNGFAVIAKEIQGLAAESREIADETSRLICETSGMLNRSSDSQYSRADESVQKIKSLQSLFTHLSDHLGNLIDQTASSIRDTGALSENVTRRLDESTVAFQFLDLVRQVIEHIISLYREIDRRPERSNAVSDCSGLILPEIEEIVRKLVTSPMELDALGLVPGKNEKSGLDANVLLF